MIRSIPNPPMDKDDAIRFRNNLRKHLKKLYNSEELKDIELRKKSAEANVKKIIDNCGGVNPLLGF